METTLVLFHGFFPVSYKRNISMGPWEHIKLRELPWHKGLGFFSWGRSFKISIEFKWELFMVVQLFEFWCCKWANCYYSPGPTNLERSQIGVLCSHILAFWVVGSLNPGLI
jgi:hypothetical protein